MVSQANLERQLNQPRLLISECGDVIYTCKALRMRKIEFHPTNPDEQLIKLGKSVFISNHRNAYKNDLGLDSLHRVTLTQAMSFNIFQYRH